MGKGTYGLAIAGSALATLTALVFVDLGVALPALFAVGAGTALIVMHRDSWKGFVPAMLAVLFGLVGLLGTLGEINTEDGGFSLGIGVALAQALVFIACIETTGPAIYRNWGNLRPWLAWGSVATRSIAAILALIFASQLSNQSHWAPFVIAILALSSMVPAILLLGEE